jgi:hypothetical protein
MGGEKMVPKGPAKKLAIYIDENARLHGKPVYEILIETFYKNSIAGVSVFRGLAGYGSDGVFHTAKIIEFSTSLPLKLEVIDTSEKIDQVLPEVMLLVEEGLVEVSDTNVIKCAVKQKKAQPQ